MNLTKIQKWGNSQGIRIPKFILDEVELEEGDMVGITSEDDKIIIFKPKRVRKKYTIDELFKDYKGDYDPAEYDWGESAGKEEW